LASRRASGILLHPISLPGRSGIGDLGPEALRFVEFLAAADQRIWQVLPLGPTGYGDSPYQCFSAFAGNPLLISLETLAADGLLAESDLANAPGGSETEIDYGAVIAYKQPLLEKAYRTFEAGASPSQRAGFEAFRRAEQRWLEDFALFTVIKEARGGDRGRIGRRTCADADRSPSPASRATTASPSAPASSHSTCSSPSGARSTRPVARRASA
jgi:4-alpha-glucanotransferase